MQKLVLGPVYVILLLSRDEMRGGIILMYWNKSPGLNESSQSLVHHLLPPDDTAVGPNKQLWDFSMYNESRNTIDIWLISKLRSSKGFNNVKTLSIV